MDNKKWFAKPCPLCGMAMYIDIDDEDGGAAFCHEKNTDCIFDYFYIDLDHGYDSIDRYLKKWNNRPLEDELNNDIAILLKIMQCHDAEELPTEHNKYYWCELISEEGDVWTAMRYYGSSGWHVIGEQVLRWLPISSLFEREK